MTTATALRAICGHDSRSVEGCLPCEAADELEAYARALAAPADSDIERLREAIQYALPVAEEEWADEQCSRMGVTTVGLAAIRKMREALRPSVAAPADSAPVAWRETTPTQSWWDYYEKQPADRGNHSTIQPLYAAPRAPAPTPTPTNIKQEIFEAAVVAHGVRFAQKLPRPDMPSLEAIWVGVDKALAAPRAPAPADSAPTLSSHERYWLDHRAGIVRALAEKGMEICSNLEKVWIRHAASPRALAPDAGTEALRDALGIGLDLATAEAAKARELYGSYPKDGLGRKCVAADADVATIERALAALSAADQGAKNDI